jgi:hypothetical protein
MVLNGRGLATTGGLVASAALSAVVFSSGPHDGFHPLALMGSLLPLQLAALLWVMRRSTSP